MENGSKKFYQIPPYSMCRIMIANTLSTNYRHFFNWDEQTFAYFTIEKTGSERYQNTNVYWD